VICNEVIGNVLRTVRGTEVSDETLALEVIKEIGPEGNFLSHKHTLKHIRDELYLPEIFDRTSEKTWEKAGGKHVHEVAKAKALKILKEHHPASLPNDVQAKLSEIVKRAERDQVKRT